MSEQTNIKPLTLKCKICGGNLVNDYISSTCLCENCGNKWAMSDMLPNIEEYSHITDKIRRAMEMLSDAANSVNLSQAVVLFKSAEADCLKDSNEVTSDLLSICKEGQEQAFNFKHYTSGKDYFEKKNYIKSRSEFEQVKNFKDADAFIEKCDTEIAASRKRRIPFAIIVGMILPAVLSVFLHEAFGVHLAICIPVFLIISALIAYGIYRGGTLSVVVEIISFLLIVPLILFSIMAYAIHMDKSLALKISIGIPILLIIVFVVLAERKN